MGSLYEVAPEPTSPEPSPVAGRGPVDKIKDALEAKGKTRVVAALDKGTISIEGDDLCVAFAPESSACKSEIEDRNRRISIEDASEQVLGRRLTLRVSITGEAVSTDSGGGRAGAHSVERAASKRAKTKGAADAEPKLQALLDKFHGEVIEVIKPE